MWWTVLVVLVGTLGVLIAWMKHRYVYWQRRGAPFLAPTLLVGNLMPALLRRTSFVELFQRHYQELKPHRFGGTFGFLTPTLLIADPDLIRTITVTHCEHFSERMDVVNEKTDPLTARALVSLKGDAWSSMRALLSPVFTADKLRAMYPLIEQCVDKFATFLTTRPHKEPLEFKAAFTRFTNDVIASVAFGHECDSVNDPEERFFKMGQSLMNFSWKKLVLFIGFSLTPRLMEFLGVPVMASEATEFFRQTIRETINFREQNLLHRPDVLQLLMEARQNSCITYKSGDEAREQVAALTDDDIAAQAFLFFLTGFETVATALSFLAHELAVNPEVQDRLHAEIKATLAESEGQFTYEGVQNMKYLDMVVQESLRKFPPAGFSDRVCTKDFLVPGTSVVIERGTDVTLPHFAFHRDPEFFPDPERFDPERFSEENRGKIRPFTFVPFGTGPRSCIGMRLALLEVKTCVCHMLTACELQVCSKTQVPLQLSRTNFMMTTDAGFWLCAVPRNRVKHPSN